METFRGFPTLDQPMPNRESSTSASYFTAFSSGQSLASSVPPPSPFPLAALLLPKAPFSKVGRHPQDAHKFHRSSIEGGISGPTSGTPSLRCDLPLPARPAQLHLGSGSAGRLALGEVGERHLPGRDLSPVKGS